MVIYVYQELKMDILALDILPPNKFPRFISARGFYQKLNDMYQDRYTRRESLIECNFRLLSQTPENHVFF